MELAHKKRLVISKVPKQKLDKLSDNQNHQGVVLSIAAFKYASIDDLFDNAKKQGTEPFFVILDNIEIRITWDRLSERPMLPASQGLLFQNTGQSVWPQPFQKRRQGRSSGFRLLGSRIFQMQLKN